MRKRVLVWALCASCASGAPIPSEVEPAPDPGRALLAREQVPVIWPFFFLGLLVLGVGAFAVQANR